MEKAAEYFFFESAGECATLARNHDWAATPVGDPSTWSTSLRNTVAMLLSSEFPMFLWWGEEMIQIYNDAYRPSFGNTGKHPLAMGQRAEECWPEIWDFIYPLIQQVRTTGKGVWYEDLYLPIFRNGQMEDVYWTFSYSAVRNDSGAIEGVLVVCTETTDKTLYLKSLNESKMTLEFAIDAAELGTWDLDPTTRRFASNARLKSWFGIPANGETSLETVIERIAETDRQKVRDAIESALNPATGGRYEVDYTIIHPQTKVEKYVRAKGLAWFDDDGIPYRFNGTLHDITPEKLAEQRITEARQLTDLAVKSVGIGFFKANFDGNTIEYTPEFAAIMTGDKNRKDLTRQLIIDHIHPDDEPFRAEAVRAGIETGEFYYTPRVIWPDGSLHRVAIMGAKIMDETGKSAMFSGTVRDITFQETQQIALEQAELRYTKAQRESEALLHNITNSSPTGLWLSDTQGALTYVNKTLVDWMGLSYNELLGSGWLNAIIPDDRQRSLDTFLDAIEHRAHYDVLFRVKKADNSIIWCRAAGDPYTDDHGEFAGYSGFCMDMDEIIASRKIIAEREMLFRSIVEQAPVATCLFVGRDMIVEVANDIMLDYWGKDRSVIGLPLAEALPELIGQPFLQILDDVFTTGVTYQDKAAPVILPLGGVLGTYYFDFTYKALRNSDGSIYGVMDMAIDVTKQVLAQREIERQQKRLLESFEESPVGIATIDSDDLVFRSANKFYGKLVGRLPADLVNQPLLKVMPEIAGQGFDELLRKVIKTGVPHIAKEVPVNLRRTDELETIYVDFTYQARRDADEVITGVLVVAVDVTQQVLTRREIETSEMALHNAIELAELSTWKLDIKNNVFVYSKRFMEWLGFAENTKSLDDAYNPLPDDYRESVQAAVKEAIKPGSNGIYDYEHPIINRITGQVRIIHANAQVVYDNNGNPEFLSGTAQDVTKERKLQQELAFLVEKRTEELRNANEELAINNLELQQFAYIASHDLQEPVRKIAVYMQLLELSLGKVNEKALDYIGK